MESNNSFILFYSNYCKHSKDFLLGLKRKDPNLFNKFTKICVDNSKVPDGIETVPTILVPTHSFPLTDNNVFEWLDSINGNNNGNGNGNGNVNTNTNESSSSDGNLENDYGISPYIRSEMGNGFSDGFSFLNENVRLKHNFTFLNDNMQNEKPITNINCDNIDRPGLNYAQKSSSDFDSEYEKYINGRDNDSSIRSAVTRK